MPRRSVNAGESHRSSFSDAEASFYASSADETTEIETDIENPLRTTGDRDRSSSTGKFSSRVITDKSRKQSLPSRSQDPDHSSWLARMLFKLTSCIYGDPRILELARLREEIAERDREEKERDLERERKRNAAEKEQLDQALKRAEERAANAEAALKVVEAEITAIKMEQKAREEASKLEKERIEAEAREKERLEAEADRAKEVSLLRQQLQALEDERLRNSEFRRLAEIESIKEAQKAARFNKVPVPITPATDASHRVESFSLMVGSTSLVDQESDIDEETVEDSDQYHSSSHVPSPPAPQLSAR